MVRRLAASPADWLTRVRLNPAGRWYERIHLDDSHEVWVISWLPGQATGFHDHGGSAGAFAVVLGTLMERRVTGGVATGQVLAKPVGAGGSRAFGPRYIHDVRNAAASSVAVSVHAYSPPLPEMTRYELTAGRAGQAGHRRRRGVVAARPPGARGIDEILAAARARLLRLTPQEAFAEASAGAVLVDIRPAAQRADAGRDTRLGRSWSATTWSGGWIPAARPGCPGSPGTTTGSSSSAWTGTPPAWPRRPCRTWACTGRPT